MLKFSPFADDAPQVRLAHLRRHQPDEFHGVAAQVDAAQVREARGLRREDPCPSSFPTGRCWCRSRPGRRVAASCSRARSPRGVWLRPEDDPAALASLQPFSVRYQGSVDDPLPLFRTRVGKRFGKVSTEQRFIRRAMVEAARAHRVVVRLKGGGPMLFGRAREELAALTAAGIAWEVVPGVAAASAAATEPLTHPGNATMSFERLPRTAP